MPQTKRAKILGVEVDSLTVSELNDEIASIARQGRNELILNVNALGLNLAYENKWLRDLFNEAYLVFCDGAGVIIGARILGYEISQRITYADWMWQLASYAEKNNLSLFFLGGKPGVADRASTVLKESFPALPVVGTYHGYFDKSQDHPDNKCVIQFINHVQPNILIVGLGMPLQERWLMENWQRLHANVMLTGGAVFDYVSGDLTRAPQWMTDHGLEWLGRLLIEPKRLWRRYILGNPLFLWRVIKQRIRKSSEGHEE
jgi:N-acetylglucosaminyldiphosphoundecaprenol N-acetyl-beta-D-mannosaminyltransferase